VWLNLPMSHPSGRPRGHGSAQSPAYICMHTPVPGDIRPQCLQRCRRHKNQQVAKGDGPFGRGDGRGDRIRTCDPLLPKQMRYQAAPLPDAPTALGDAQGAGKADIRPCLGQGARRDRRSLGRHGAAAGRLISRLRASEGGCRVWLRGWLRRPAAEARRFCSQLRPGRMTKPPSSWDATRLRRHQPG
jgi:hypothetical protein